jgi:cyclic pyranopterin phosphate synthase
MLVDPFGRQSTYLRISLTVNCNLRCVYCMPPDGIPAAQTDELLTNDEIVSIVRSASSGGRSLRKGGLGIVRSNLTDSVIPNSER